MLFSKALEKALLDQDDPISTDYEFFRLGLRLFTSETWNGEPLSRRPASWDQEKSKSTIRRLVKKRVLAPDNDFGSGVWRVIQSSRSGAAEEISCIVDPFCYVSHLSAMQRFGLTDRSPEALHLTTPARPLWNEKRDRKVEAEVGGSMMERAPKLLRVGFMEKIRRRPVIIHVSSHPAKPQEVRGERTRISPIGRTFVDMLSEPVLCGGMRHVLDVWQNEALSWIDEIIENVGGFESKIVKVRAGYIISELMSINDARVEGWLQFAQRGGSRKLDPDSPYAPKFSERWMLSLNV